MKLNTEFNISIIEGEAFLAPAGTAVTDVNSMLDLDDVSVFVVEQLQQDRDFDEIIDLIYGEFDVDKKVIQDDLSEFITAGKEIGFIVE